MRQNGLTGADATEKQVTVKAASVQTIGYVHRDDILEGTWCQVRTRVKNTLNEA